MKAAVFDNYGAPEVVYLDSVPTPVPTDKDILVKVHAAAVTAADSRIRRLHLPPGFGLLGRLMFGISAPRNRVLGGCFSGVVEAVGANVSGFKVGDEVTGMTGMAMGAHAEFVVTNTDKALAHKPQGLSHEEAAAVAFGGTTALYFLRDLVKLQPGQKILVNGASGAVGSNAVQLAKHFGAEVAGVCSGKNAALVTSLGADRVIDYTKTDVLDPAQMEGKYDIVMDTVGNLPKAEARHLLNETGRLVLVVGGLGDMLFPGKRVVTGTAPERSEDLQLLLELTSAGKIKAVIDKVYAFDDIAAAHRHVDSGHKVGNVVVRVT